MSLDLSGLDAPAEPPVTAGGGPLELPIAEIDEDPDQPRFEFDDESLAELAETIRERGVRQPVSVRPHPKAPGRWMLNFGARRLRASVLAGRRTVPAFVDASADSYDQIIENEQRQNLQPLELALFVQRRMRAGETQAEIARRLGKSRGYVTQVSALIDAPDPVMDLYRSGRCRGLTELYELRRLHQANAQAVTDWLAGTDAVTRTAVERLKERLRPRHAPGPAVETDMRQPSEPQADATAVASEGPAPAPVAEAAPSVASTTTDATSSSEPASSVAPQRRRPSLTLLACFEGTEVVVDLRAIAEIDGQVFVAPVDGGRAVAVDIERLDQLRLIRSGRRLAANRTGVAKVDRLQSRAPAINSSAT